MSPDSLEPAGTVVAIDDAKPAPHADAHPTGFIDAAAGRKVSGWVWDKSRPDLHFDVEIRYDDTPLATVTADRARPDLVRAGVGDGTYSFEAKHDRDITEDDCHRISAVVRLADGREVSLSNRAAKTAKYSVLKPEDLVAIRTAIDEWPAEQRELLEQLGKRFMAMGAELRRLRDAISGGDSQDGKTDAQQETALAAALAEMRQTQEALDHRMAEIDVFHSRFDGALSELKRDRKRPEAPTIDHTLRRMVFLLSLVSGASMLIGIISLLR